MAQPDPVFGRCPGLRACATNRPVQPFGYLRLTRTDATTSRRTVRLLSSMKRGQCSILVQLRSGHVGLRSYLARFAHVDSPICERCATPETVEHYLTACKRYTRARSELIRSFRYHTNSEIRGKSKDVALLSHPDAIPITLRYIAATNRFPLHTPNTLTQAIQATLPSN